MFLYIFGWNFGKRIQVKNKARDKMISVIVPVYNTVNYVRYCVESILSQTMKDFELILVDDGSSDGSEKICDEY